VAAQDTVTALMRLACAARRCTTAAERQRVVAAAEATHRIAWGELAHDIYAAHAHGEMLPEQWRTAAYPQPGGVEGTNVDLDHLVDAVLESTPAGLAYQAVLATAYCG
jgi:hypothetical protein